MKQREFSIDFMKFIAVLLVINSHMAICYGQFSQFATGGTIANAFFFFVSGYTLCMSYNTQSFRKWYIRRLNRIIPTIFAMGIIGALVLNKQQTLMTVISMKDYWFVQSILIYYIIVFPMLNNKKYLSKILCLVLLLVILLYIFVFDFDKIDNLYAIDDWCRKVLYLSIMIAGIWMCENKRKFKSNILAYLCLGVSIVLYFVLARLRNSLWQMFSLFPLILICVFTYSIGSFKLVMKLFNNKVIGPIVYIISALCLDCYLIQFDIIAIDLKLIFPFNMLIIYLLVIISAYVLHIISGLIIMIMGGKEINMYKLFLFKK